LPFSFCEALRWDAGSNLDDFGDFKLFQSVAYALHLNGYFADELSSGVNYGKGLCLVYILPFASVSIWSVPSTYSYEESMVLYLSALT
jgi:hypothetical protein